MTDTHDQHEHHGPDFKTYMIVAAALTIFTVVSFVVNGFVRADTLTPVSGFAIIMSVAVIKAALVSAYFMHLVMDWSKVYYFIIPAFILGAMMMVVLLPDIVLSWRLIF